MEPIILEYYYDVHKKGEGTDYTEKVDDKPRVEKFEDVKDSTKDSQKI